MGIEYHLTLAGDIPLDELAALAAPGATERASFSGARLLSTPTDSAQGYGVSIIEERDGYCEAESDNGQRWEWEPGRSVAVTFHMNKFADREQARLHMLRTVAAVLHRRTEDAALTLNGDWLMLTRMNGRLRLHNASDWHHPSYEGVLDDTLRQGIQEQ
ncbi:SitI3 family protein [Micromonospora fluostatini]|uniref:SitI3 family protein n=1 Tax=Micromonospora sp. JCM 30529 TaxID=3421643 RepID=UPI003D16D7F3